MDVRFLNTFIEVANTRHFGKAAENLYLTQSAVSARIKHLEEYFNAPLFIRERHSIRLTAVGENLLPFAISIVETLQEARKALEDFDVQHISLAGSPNAWSMLFTQVYTLTQHYFEQLSLRSEVLSHEQLSRKLHERTIDIAFSLESLKSDDIETQKVGDIPLAMYCSRHLVDKDYLKYFIHINWGAKILAPLYAKLTQCRHAKFQTDSMQLALEMLKSNEDVSIILPKSVAHEHVSQGILVEKKDVPTLTVPLFISCLQSTRKTALKDYFDFYTNGEHYVKVVHENGA